MRLQRRFVYLESKVPPDLRNLARTLPWSMLLWYGWADTWLVDLDNEDTGEESK